ncbi:hypothetical protein [Bradyrhizobium sp. HKCCYLS20291]|uniref:hypothetical protein n=1 Tax=Bradyrhizobium sp. HKCCYLS20291 TaxID=3420766 RepID=UPI003EBC3E91
MLGEASWHAGGQALVLSRRSHDEEAVLVSWRRPRCAGCVAGQAQAGIASGA